MKSIEKVYPNDKEYLPVKITSKKVHRNDVHFSPIEITSKKAGQKDAEFFSYRNYIEKVHQNDREICRYCFFQHINKILTLKRRRFDVLCPLRTRISYFLQ